MVSRQKGGCSDPEASGVGAGVQKACAGEGLKETGAAGCGWRKQGAFHPLKYRV